MRGGLNSGNLNLQPTRFSGAEFWSCIIFLSEFLSRQCNLTDVQADPSILIDMPLHCITSSAYLHPTSHAYSFAGYSLSKRGCLKTEQAVHRIPCILTLVCFAGVTAVSNVCSLYQAVIGPKRVHRYPTKENRPQLAMDQVQKELADMRERMDQFMTLMTGMAEGQEKLRELVEQPRPDPEVEIPNAKGNPGNPGNADNPVNTGNTGNANADGNPGNVGNTGNVGNGIGGRYNVNQGIRINGPPVTEDYQYDQFSLHNEALETTRRMDELAEKLKSLESQNSLGFDVTNLGLVQGVRIPHKFKLLLLRNTTGLLAHALISNLIWEGWELTQKMKNCGCTILKTV